MVSVKYPTLVASNNPASTPIARPPSRQPSAIVTPTSAIPANHDGSRAAHSGTSPAPGINFATPMTSQYISGGFLRRASSLKLGTRYSPDAIISRADCATSTSCPSSGRFESTPPIGTSAATIRTSAIHSRDRPPVASLRS
ncbi:MAG: hypothetical protein R3B46_08145 [Phycisphaerales bacterium]